MPRYEVRLTAPSAADVERSISLLARRFPEVDVLERGDADADGAWICQAPSANHLLRWATAADLQLTIVDHVEEDQP